MVNKINIAVNKSINLNLNNDERFNEETVELMEQYVKNEITAETLVRNSIASLIGGK